MVIVVLRSYRVGVPLELAKGQQLRGQLVRRDALKDRSEPVSREKGQPKSPAA